MLLRLITALVLVATPLAAQDRMALAREYVALPANQQMMTDMFSPASMAAQFMIGLPPVISVTDAQQARIGEILSGVMNGVRPQMEASMTTAAAEAFTAEELSALIAFYSTEIGASILGKNQAFFQTVMADIQPQIMNNTQSVLPELIQILQGN